MEHSRRIDMGYVSPGETSGFRPRRDRSIACVVIGISRQLNTLNLVPCSSSSLVNTHEERVKIRGPGRDAIKRGQVANADMYECSRVIQADLSRKESAIGVRAAEIVLSV